MAASGTENYNSVEDAVQSIFQTNKCYDLIPNSCKVIVFESAIPFQLAFYALVEHDGEVAPIWDPINKIFVGLMTTMDFVEALRLYHIQGISSYDLANRSIEELLKIPKKEAIIKHSNFTGIDAESSLLQMCFLLYNMNSEYIPVVDPIENNIVGVLGYLDALYLLAHSAQQFSLVASMTVNQLSTLPHVERPDHQQLSAPKNALFHSVLSALKDQNLSCIPIVDEDGRVVSLYQISDVAFLSRATNPDLIIANFSNLTIYEVIQQQQLNETSMGPAPVGYCHCNLSTNMKDLFDSMINFRITRSVCVDGMGRLICVVEVKDILRHFLRNSTTTSAVNHP